jgi:hypothetical protein
MRTGTWLRSPTNRKAVVAIGSVAVLAAALYMAWPWVPTRLIEFHVARDCPQSNASESCVVRMRALGHAWSAQGSLARAEYWYGRSAEQGDPSAMFALGWLNEMRAIGQFKALVEAQRLKFGAKTLDGGPDDVSLREIADTRSEAEQWYRKSADKGFAPAMNNLGELYQLGIDGHSDPGQAFNWYMAAARAGNPVGAWNLAIAYMRGYGVDRDDTKAKQWLTWSPSTGSPRDLLWPILERTKLFGSDIPADRLALIRAAARAGSPVTLTVEPMKPSAELPTFHPVIR